MEVVVALIFVSIYAYSGVARFITAYVTGGYIFASYDLPINQPTTSSYVDNFDVFLRTT